MKKYFTLLICLCLFLSLLTITADATVGSFGVNIDAYMYTTNDNPFYAKGWGQCTWYCWGRAVEKCGECLKWGAESNVYGDANDWYDNAQGFYSVGTAPRANSIAVWKDDSNGHVAFVESIDGDILYLTESNLKEVKGYIEGWLNLSTGAYTNTSGNVKFGYYNDSDTWNGRGNPYGYIYLPDNTTPTAPTVHASPIGKEVDITWNDVGANSYYIYVQNKADQSIPYGNNVGRNLSIHLGLTEGDFNVYVTAVYSNDNMKTGYSEFSTRELLPSINKGAESSYNLNEPVVISLNTDVSAVESCILNIYRTPTGGDTFLYWEGQVFSPQYTSFFSNEGHYSCYYILTRNNHAVESGWVGWNIRENNLCATVDKGQDGEYNLNEPVIMSVNADVSTVDSCILKIYRTPANGETYLYWEGQVFTSQHTVVFPNEGYYSCCFILVYNNIWTESQWVGWNVKAPITFTLPSSLKCIEDEAFAGITNCIVRIPDGVAYVSPTAFDPSVTLVVTSGSTAANAVKNIGLNVIEE